MVTYGNTLAGPGVAGSPVETRSYYYHHHVLQSRSYNLGYFYMTKHGYTLIHMVTYGNTPAGPGVAGSPVEIRRAALVSCRRLLPRMHLAGYSSNILHPLLRVLDGGVDELRTDALDTICSLALALGPDFPIFAPTVRKVCGTQLLTLDNTCCWYGLMMC